jgi:SNF2 family DNA or RNA helicase
VFHWLDEARRFAPKLAMLEWHGLRRGDHAAELATADVIVTTYATLRLDLDRLAAIDYATVVLDEAHAIKTATTATASAARALRADFRLALTGTPVENRLDDLASIFDYLNPGLLGRTAVLRAVGDASPEPANGRALPTQDPRRHELAHARALGKVLRPFMMRRTKEQVLTELPAKSEVELTCRLEGGERRRYDELREHYRRSLLPEIERKGIQRNAIIVLEALLRLRQAAVHPGLLDSRLATADSAKLDALVEYLNEARASATVRSCSRSSPPCSGSPERGYGASASRTSTSTARPATAANGSLYQRPRNGRGSSSKRLSQRWICTRFQPVERAIELMLPWCSRSSAASSALRCWSSSLGPAASGAAAAGSRSASGR